MNPEERQYWDRWREAEAVKREQERERAMQFPPGALEEAEFEYRLQGAQKAMAEAREREARGCHCTYRAGNEDDLWWRNQQLAEPRRDCPLHSHLVPEFEERRRQAERELQERERAQQERNQAEARKRAAEDTVKGVFSYVFFWPAVIVAVFVVSFVIAIVPMIVITAVLGFVGLAIGGIGWVALLIFLIWQAPGLVEMLDELGGLGILIGVIVWAGTLFSLWILWLTN